MIGFSSGWFTTPSTTERSSGSQGILYRPAAGPPTASVRTVIPTMAIAERHLLSLGCFQLPVSAAALWSLGLAGPGGLRFRGTLALGSAGDSSDSVQSAAVKERG